MRFREATLEDDAQLTRLVAKPMPGNLSLSFSRDPSFLRSCAECGPPRRVLTASDGDELLALCTHFLWPLRVGKSVREVWTVADFRAVDRAAHRGITGRGWGALKQRLEGKPALISVVRDNPLSLKLFSKARKGWPRLHPVAALQTRFVPLWGNRAYPPPGFITPSASQIATALQEHKLSFSPVIEENDIGRVTPPLGEFVARFDGTEILACGALWDAGEYRQVKVARYGGWYRSLRSLLPPPQTEVRVCFAAFLVGRCAQSRGQVFRELARRASRRGATFLVHGCDASEPSPVPRHWPHFTYPSRLYQLLWDDHEPLPPAARAGYEVAWL